MNSSASNVPDSVSGSLWLTKHELAFLMSLSTGPHQTVLTTWGTGEFEVLRPGHVWWRDLGDVTTTEARRILKYREGWTRQTIDGHQLDLCPACTALLAQWREANDIKRSARATG